MHTLVCVYVYKGMCVLSFTEDSFFSMVIYIFFINHHRMHYLAFQNVINFINKMILPK